VIWRDTRLQCSSLRARDPLRDRCHRPRSSFFPLNHHWQQLLGIPSARSTANTTVDDPHSLSNRIGTESPCDPPLGRQPNLRSLKPDTPCRRTRLSDSTNPWNQSFDLNTTPIHSNLHLEQLPRHHVLSTRPTPARQRNSPQPQAHSQLPSLLSWLPRSFSLIQSSQATAAASRPTWKSSPNRSSAQATGSGLNCLAAADANTHPLDPRNAAPCLHT